MLAARTALRAGQRAAPAMGAAAARAPAARVPARAPAARTPATARGLNTPPAARPDYVAGDKGVVPADLYRYMPRKYAESTKDAGVAPKVTYVSPERHDDAAEAGDALQVKPEWSDMGARATIHAEDVYDKLQIPKRPEDSAVGKPGDPAPLVDDYPAVGLGGGPQYHLGGADAPVHDVQELSGDNSTRKMPGNALAPYVPPAKDLVPRAEE